jgi:hypothetical protein
MKVSSTCKCLAVLCAPVLFRFISLEEDDSERQSRLAENSQGLGQFVHELRFTLSSSSSNGKVLCVYQMLAHMPNIRSLTVIHDREDIAGHAAFLSTIERFSRLERLTLQEKNYDPAFNYLPHRNVEVPQTFFDQFLCKVMELYGHGLKAIYLFTLLPLREELYIKIRDLTPNLRSITFTGSIDVGLQSQFAKPIPWASSKSGSLERLTLHNCAGVHAGNFVQNLLYGVYGTRLKSVQLIACGDSEIDTPSIPSASTPTYVMVNHLHLDHMSGWELEALSRIPVQDLSLTRLLPDDIFCSVLIVQSRALRVQGGGRFSALGVRGLWGAGKNLYCKYKVE